MSISSCTTKEPGQFDYIVDNFADIQVLRYKVPEFDSLSLQQKQLVYHLTEAALSGRDILWDQNGKYNLAIRDLLEQVYKNYDGAKDNADYLAFETYLKQIWFANGIHHHYSMDKFQPKFSREFLETEVAKLPKENLPKTDLLVLYDVIFNPETMPKKVNQSEGQDLILTSASNIYEGVTQPEVEAYYASIKDTTITNPVSYGLNTKKIKVDGKVVEQPYKIGGLYTEAIERIVSHLKAASEFAENPEQKAHIEKLIEYYTTGSLKNFDEYSILWVKDTDSQVDFINGFIESYDDPLGMTGSWESIVNFKNRPASRRTETISAEAQWFENNSPVDSRFKKETVKGVTAKVITAAILAGDAYPATPIGINLPNANWIRATHGSKSVTLENITQAYDEASHGSGFNEEFVIDKETSDLLDKYLFITDNLHTDLHECLGHGSGKLLPGVDPDALKAYGSTLEEARADLFALYYLADPKLIELGLLDSPDAYKAEYYKYILNGLMTQLMRIEPGKDVEEAHMRNRKLIAEWCFQKGSDEKVIELVKRDGKTYVRINDYPRLRELFGELLAEVQRIKSEGDYEAGRKLVETYGVRVDPEVHAEVLKRYEHLNIAPYKGFVNPVYELVKDSDGNVTDVTVRYDEDYVPQMLRYSKDYSSLPR
ncbi:dihydrofolate reductase [uncultured Muribaculum sp.]|uniref:dipeptidyl-peptidase 3 family protein n=1 Tax=uncultured Muribaculum sp. TaxID=1918613 RepID=UPI0025B16B3F|nr:dihydrofolate reductase [uncultured Muribaculum sp.]